MKLELPRLSEEVLSDVSDFIDSFYKGVRFIAYTIVFYIYYASVNDSVYVLAFYYAFLFSSVGYIWSKLTYHLGRIPLPWKQGFVLSKIKGFHYYTLILMLVLGYWGHQQLIKKHVLLMLQSIM